MENKFVSATCHLKNDKIVLITFIEDEDLYVINNLGNKHILLGKDKKSEFDDLLLNLKNFHQITSSIEKLIDTNNYKETESLESVRLKKAIKPL